MAVFVIAAALRLYRLDAVPSGLLYDEAYNGVDVLRILAGERPVFLPENFGREALFIYFQALSVALLGPTDLALRVVAAVVGLLTVPTSYVLLRRLFGRRVAALACGWLAVSLWHVIFSRIGLRAVSLPLLETASFYCLWSGLATAGEGKPTVRSARPEALAPHTLVWFALSGLLLGLALHAYTAARFVPLVFIAFAGYLWTWHRPRLRASAAGLVLAGLVALAVFVPQGLYFVRHPDAFTSRAAAVSIFNPDLSPDGPLAALSRATLGTLGMFAVEGDHYWDRNVPGRPVFDPVSAALGVLGIVVAARRLRRPEHGFLAIWLAVMLAPSLLAIKDVPNALRVVGLIPAVFALPALGLAWLWERWDARVSGPPRALSALAVLALLLAAGTLTCRDYYRVWAPSPVVAQAFSSDRWLAATLARSWPVQEERVWIASGEPDSPRLRYALAGSGEPGRVRAFEGARSLILPSEDSKVSYLFPDSARPPAAILERVFPGQAGETIARTPRGDAVSRFRLPHPRPALSPQVTLSARFAHRLEALGFDLPRDVRAGESLTVTWHWRLLAPTAVDLALSNQLFDEAGERRGQLDDRAFAPAYWEAGTLGLTTFEVEVDPAATTGAHWLDVAVYDRSSLARLEVFDGHGRLAGSHLRLGPIKVHGRPRPDPGAVTPLRAEFDDGITLEGYSLGRESVGRAEALDLTLHWSARRRPSRDYTVFVHLLDAGGQPRGQGDGPPRSGLYPTSIWDAGEVVVDPHRVVVATDAPPGQYRLAIGLYERETGRRVPALGIAEVPRDHVLISGVEVR